MLEKMNLEFYKELESSLPKSTGQQRKMWAATIIEKNIDLKDLSRLLKFEQKIATRFLWLLSDIGIQDPGKLFSALPFLLEACEHLDNIYKTSFASLWLIASVPPENEGKAIDLLFQWLLSTDINVTLKARSFLVLFNLTKKYPELKNELKLCLEDQLDKYTKDFRKRASKILIKLQEGLD